MKRYFQLNYNLIVYTFFLFLTFSIIDRSFAQVDSVYSTINGKKYSPFAEYQATAPKINDLIHTKLAVRFDYDKAYLYGKEWVTLEPHYYSVDSLTLNAKGMEIHQVSLVKGTELSPLKFEYNDSQNLIIRLDREYRKSESYTIFIDYTARPNEIKNQGSRAIQSAKGLYFINPRGEETNKPIQIWTQGETESNSCWFPTIDKPNQKTTEEIEMTVPDKYVTLSNGEMTGQHKNPDGTRTDTWKLDKPNAPYLFMMAVGDFIKTEDHWNNIPVDYYLEPAYAPYARQIFGNTPEMIAYYSRVLGVNYPWNKYAQIVVRDYVSGAMENTTATLHGEFVQKTPRELLDNNSEAVISHELFHQWFGDYVTTESWSNITVNESMADYAETLWFEYKYGKDRGDENNYNDLVRYLGTPHGSDHNLVPFYYSDKETIFDNVSYPKGGYILSMLRYYVGDSAFFDALHNYLTRYAYGNAEAQQLRLAFEEVTGKDLTWFWDQWYYGKGYPELEINYEYDDQLKTARVFISQVQDNPRIFRLPMAIDVFADNQKHRIDYQMDAQYDTINIPYPNGKKPDLINVDGDKILLAKIHDHKSLDNFIFQYQHAGNYVSRRQSIEEAALHQDDAKAVQMLLTAMKDPSDELRILTASSLDLSLENVKKSCQPALETMAVNDPKSTVKAAAIIKLGTLNSKKEVGIFLKAIKDPSYAVESAGLQGIYAADKKKGLQYADQFLNDHRGDLNRQLAIIFAESGSSKYLPFYYSIYEETRQRFRLGKYFIDYLTHVKEPGVVKEAVSKMMDMNSSTNSKRLLGLLKSNLQTIQKAKSTESELSAFIQSQIDQLQNRIDGSQ